MDVSSLGMTISGLEMDFTLVMVGKACVVFVFFIVAIIFAILCKTLVNLDWGFLSRV